MKIRWLKFAMVVFFAVVQIQCSQPEGFNPAAEIPIHTPVNGLQEPSETSRGDVFENNTPSNEGTSVNQPSRDIYDRSTGTDMPEFIDPSMVPDGHPIVGEVPGEILEMIIADLVRRTNAVVENILEIRSQAVVWNDGSMGCPQPGVFYTQAQVEGFWVLLAYEGKEYDYRAAASGEFFLCENGHPPILPPGTPES